jgi:demethylmenaquinone methyltransferase/2-methoxy-6-polyprenyl-1,4-benzoquinol methylase
MAVNEQAIMDSMIEYYRKRAPVYDESMGYTDSERWHQHAGLVDLLKENLADRDTLEIACGPGCWTRAVATGVRSLIATDVNEAVLAEARKKSYPQDRVCFQNANAYTLHGVEGPFTAGFAVDWWSHMPKSKIPAFLTVFHERLTAGARVIFVDQLPREALDRMFLRYDSEGNLIQRRWLPSGQQFEVIKNFPDQDELLLFLEGSAGNVDYFVHGPTQRWVLTYTVV